MIPDITISSSLYPLTPEEKDLHDYFMQIADTYLQDVSPDTFMPEEDYPDEQVDPTSAYFGYIFGCQTVAELLFEILVTVGRDGIDESGEEHILH